MGLGIDLPDHLSHSKVSRTGQHSLRENEFHEFLVPPFSIFCMKMTHIAW